MTLEYVEGLKQKHSKTQNYDTFRLSTSPYLNDSRFTKTERELLFKLRSRTIQVKYNFQNANLQNMLCELCNLFTCTHLSCVNPAVYNCEHNVCWTQLHIWKCWSTVDVYLDIQPVLGCKKAFTWFRSSRSLKGKKKISHVEKCDASSTRLMH